MDSQAVRPSFYQEFTTKVNEVIEDEKKDEKTEALSYITHFRGWTILKDYQKSLLGMLDEGLRTAISNGATTKEIGERALIKEMATFVLNSFVEKADHARRTTDK
jgi:hypothetical protein